MPGQDLVQRQREMVAFADEPQLVAEIEAVLPENVSVAKFKRGLMNAVLEDPTVIDADRGSLYRAVLRAATDGLIPDGREAAITVFNDRRAGVKKAQYLPMIGGLRKILAEYGWTLYTGVIRANDDFEDHTAEGFIVHRPPRPGVDRGDREGAYAMAVHRDGRRIAEVYDEKQIAKAKAVAKTDQIWNKWPDQMAEKTVGHRLADKVPLDSKDRERLERVFAATDVNGDDATALLYGEPREQQQAGVPGLSSLPRRPAGSRTQGGARTPDATPSASSAPPTPESESTEPIEGEIVHEGDGSEADDIQFGDDPEQPFEGQEPPTDDTEPESEGEEPTFTAGRYEGKTVQEVYDLGDVGVKYLKWAVRSWTTGSIVDSLAAFAEKHPEIKP